MSCFYRSVTEMDTSSKLVFFIEKCIVFDPATAYPQNIFFITDKITYDNGNDMFNKLNSEITDLSGALKRYLLDNGFAFLTTDSGLPRIPKITRKYRMDNDFDPKDPLLHFYPSGAEILDLRPAIVNPTESFLKIAPPPLPSLWQKLKSFLSNKEQ